MQKGPYKAYSPLRLLPGQIALAALPKLGEMSPSPSSSPTASSTPEASIVSPITPLKNDGSVNCAADQDGNGAIMSDCAWPAGSSIIQDQRLDGSSTFCTTDPETNCLRHGKNMNDAGEILGSWCVIAQSNSCAFVIADKDPHFGGGFTGSGCISGQHLIGMSVKGASQCASTSPGTAAAAGPVQVDGVPAQTLCLLSKDHPEVCAVN